jgi:hypothetical protein
MTPLALMSAFMSKGTKLRLLNCSPHETVTAELFVVLQSAPLRVSNTVRPTSSRIPMHTGQVGLCTAIFTMSTLIDSGRRIARWIRSIGKQKCHWPRQQHAQTAPAIFDHAFQCTQTKAPSIQCPINPFVFDINLRTSSGGKVMKRVLLDTGSDLNLISDTAFRDLNLQLRLQSEAVRSLAGASSIAGETTLRWSFLDAPPFSKSDFQDNFSVLASSEAPVFDCLLGHPWIAGHFDIFTALACGQHD